MAVTAADLTSPTGELRTDWFTDPDLPTAAGVWITLGEAQVPDGATGAQSDAVVTAYAYVRAYGDMLRRMAVDPNSISIEKGDIAVSFSGDQRALVNGWLTDWEDALATALADVDTEVIVTYDPPRVSQSVRAAVSF